MYKVGDLVRLLNDRLHFKKDDIFIIKEVRSEHVMLCDDWGIIFDKVEPVTHLTTKEFIKLVEDMGYELDIRTGVIFIKTKNFREVGWVRTDYECSAAFNFECDKLLLDIFYLYANTPLELRKEIEQLYTLELPNTTIKARYFRFGLPHATHSYKFGALPKSTPNGDIDYQTYFTQEEIDQLHNQELIKTLIKKKVKDNE